MKVRQIHKRRQRRPPVILWRRYVEVTCEVTTAPAPQPLRPGMIVLTNPRGPGADWMYK